MNDKREILQHCLGDKTCWRNKYFLYPESEDFDLCQKMVADGLMVQPEEDPELFGDGVYFFATNKGKVFAWGAQ